MKLHLISPSLKDPLLSHTKKEIKSFWFARLSLAAVAALTPPDVEINFTDEQLEPINFNKNYDLVGISCMTPHAPRAYEIADIYRNKGIKVVLGGIHPTVLPQEAIQYCDAVVIGEAEGQWEKLISDFKNNRLENFYKTDKYPSLSNLPIPRRDLFKKNAYMTTNTIQTTRGCPFACDFCSVTEFFGNTYRFRPVEEVINELKILGAKFVAIVDDNIVGNPNYAKKLFTEIIPLNIKWGSQGSLTMAKDKELLSLAARSGCISMFIGIESVSQDNLESVGKNFNRVDQYQDSIKKIHDHGIMINAGFVFGLDNDDESIFERTLSFIEKNKVEMASFHILTPFPGTRLFNKLKEENRIFDYDWGKYNGGNVVFRPKLMNEETLLNGFYWISRQTYSWRSIINRVALHTKQRWLGRIALNVGYRRLAKRCPKKELSPMSSVLAKIPLTISSQEIKTSIQKTKEKTQKIVEDLTIMVKKNERLKALIIEFNGAINEFAFNKIKTKMLVALKESGNLSLVIDFKNINYVNPQAFSSFLSRLQKTLENNNQVYLISLNQQMKDVWINFREFIPVKNIFDDREHLAASLHCDLVK